MNFTNWIKEIDCHLPGTNSYFLRWPVMSTLVHCPACEEIGLGGFSKIPLRNAINCMKDGDWPIEKITKWLIDNDLNPEQQPVKVVEQVEEEDDPSVCGIGVSD